MNLDELRTVQSKERSKDSLQHLRESFYADVADYVADLRERRDRAAERADNPFDDPEVNRLTDEIHTAEEVVEAIYERRVGKVVKRASLAAAGMPADEEGLTSEEQELFGELVETIETNKEAVLDVLAGEDAGGLDLSGGTSAESSATTSTPEAAPEPGDAPAPSEPAPEAGGSPADDAADVSAADVMGGGSGGGPATAPSERGASDGSSGTDADGSRPETAEADATAPASGESAASGAADSGDGGSDDAETGGSPDADSDPLAGLDERTTVRLTSDVGEIFGVDERTYDLASEDVVTLPEANAEPLLERDAAEKIE
jgi:DNA replication factor GINS